MTETSAFPKKRRRAPLFLAVTLAILAGGAWGVSRLRGASSGTSGGLLRFGRAAAKEADRTVHLKNGDIAVKVSETGALEPVTQIEVKSRVAGRVQRLLVREGDRVTQGALLATIDPTELRREFDRLAAQRASAVAGLEQAKENYELSQKQSALAIRRAEVALVDARARLAQTSAPTRSQEVTQAEIALARAEAQALDSQRTLTRKKNLVERGFIAQADADSAQITATLADTEVKNAQSRLSLAREGARTVDVDLARVGVTSAQVQLETEKANAKQSQLRLRDVERARAEVAQIDNQLAQQRVQLGETNIVAPIGGEILGKYVEVGELVASATAGFAQGAALVKIADLSRMQVRVNINEVDIARVHIGQIVEIRADGVPGKVFQGRVAALAPASGSSTSSTPAASSASVVRFEVKITVLSPEARLRPGMTAAVDIILDRHKNVAVLPIEALQDGNKVTVSIAAAEKDAAPTTQTRTIHTGLRDDAFVEVLSGLSNKDAVVLPKLDAPDRRKVDFTTGK